MSEYWMGILRSFVVISDIQRKAYGDDEADYLLEANAYSRLGGISAGRKLIDEFAGISFSIPCLVTERMK